MPLQKQNITFNFQQGLNLKQDPNQIPFGQFLELENTIFTKGGLLQKRNGFQKIGSTLDSNYQYVSTFNENLVSIGANIANYSSSSQTFVNKGSTTQAQLSVMPLIRSNSTQSQVDSAISSNGLICTVYTDTVPSTAYKYAIADATTGQNIIAPVTISSPSESPRVFVLGSYFIILFSQSANINYIYIPITNPSSPSGSNTFVNNYSAGSSQLAFDGVVANNNLYIAYNGSDGGGAIRMSYINSFLVRQTAVTGTNVANAQTCSIMSICADTTASSGITTVVWLAFYKSATTTTYVLAVDGQLNSVLAKTSKDTTDTMLNLTCVAENAVLYLFYEVSNNYSWDSSIPSHYLGKIIVSQAGTLLDKRVFVLSLGLASKAFILNSQTTASFKTVFASGATTMQVSSPVGLFIGQILVDTTTAGNLDPLTQIVAINGNIVTINTPTLGASAASPGDSVVTQKKFYVLGAYQSSYQPSYFLMDGTTGQVGSANGIAIGKLAYSNGGGYLTKGLPSVSQIGSVCSMAYLFKDLITPVNKNTNVAAGNQVNGIYAQLGINLASWNFSQVGLNTVEIGQNLNISGGIMQAYDGYTVSEQGFNLWPDLDLNADGTYHGLTSATSGGHVADSTKFYYVAVYSWTDNQGNIFRSAPSVPVTITTGNSASNVNTNTFKVPTLRVTSKLSNPVKIEAYRWSTAQQNYYLVTSVTAPTLNDVTADSVTITDTFADATILGNALLYTTGGVVEDIAPPATKAMTLFKSRLFLIDAEDPNLLWYSKQVIEATPVEMSDLFTIFVAPSVSAQGNTGPMTAISSMDDKLIIFKREAIYYLTGTGPDNTGANNDFSDPVFVTSTIGCTNQNSIVFIPSGLMFQSDKGIWLLGRDLSTQYIGAPVESFNSSTILSATTIPGTNQVRFVLNTGEVLVFDYFYNQWNIFKGISQLSCTLFGGLHTFVNSYGQIFQENPGSYLDGSRPVLIHFLTGWFNLAGLKGYQRAYFFYFLAKYFSPHKLTIGIAYDYDPSIVQSSIITPDNFNGVLGNTTQTPILGDGSPLGGPSASEEWRIFLNKQKCESFQISLTESYDASFNVAAGAGFNMSGMNLIIGAKRAYPTLPAARSVG